MRSLGLLLLFLLPALAVAQAPRLEVGGSLSTLRTIDADPIDFDRAWGGFAALRLADWDSAALALRVSGEVAPQRFDREGASYLGLIGPEVETRTGLPLHLGIGLGLGVAHFSQPGNQDTYLAGDLQVRIGHRFGPVRADFVGATSLWARPYRTVCAFPEGIVDGPGCGEIAGYRTEGRARFGVEIAVALWR